MAKSELKKKLCQNLINSKLVKVGDVIEHSYTDGGGRDLKRLIISNDGICPTMTTRIDCLGVVVEDKRNGNKKI